MPNVKRALTKDRLLEGVDGPLTGLEVDLAFGGETDGPLIKLYFRKGATLPEIRESRDRVEDNYYRWIDDGGDHGALPVPVFSLKLAGEPEPEGAYE